MGDEPPSVCGQALFSGHGANRAFAHPTARLDSRLFASDYPHWDFDDPVMAIPPILTDEQRAMIFSGNAKRLFGLA